MKTPTINILRLYHRPSNTIVYALDPQPIHDYLSRLGYPFVEARAANCVYERLGPFPSMAFVFIPRTSMDSLLAAFEEYGDSRVTIDWLWHESKDVADDSEAFEIQRLCRPGWFYHTAYTVLSATIPDDEVVVAVFADRRYLWRYPPPDDTPFPEIIFDQTWPPQPPPIGQPIGPYLEVLSRGELVVQDSRLFTPLSSKTFVARTTNPYYLAAAIAWDMYHCVISPEYWDCPTSLTTTLATWREDIKEIPHGSVLFSLRDISYIYSFNEPIAHAYEFREFILEENDTLSTLALPVSDPYYQDWFNPSPLQHPSVPWSGSIIEARYDNDTFASVRATNPSLKVGAVVSNIGLHPIQALCGVSSALYSYRDVIFTEFRKDNFEHAINADAVFPFRDPVPLHRLLGRYPSASRARALVDGDLHYPLVGDPGDTYLAWTGLNSLAINQSVDGAVVLYVLDTPPVIDPDALWGSEFDPRIMRLGQLVGDVPEWAPPDVITRAAYSERYGVLIDPSHLAKPGDTVAAWASQLWVRTQPQGPYTYTFPGRAIYYGCGAGYYEYVPPQEVSYFPYGVQHYQLFFLLPIANHYARFVKECSEDIVATPLNFYADILQTVPPLAIEETDTGPRIHISQDMLSGLPKYGFLGTDGKWHGDLDVNTLFTHRIIGESPDVPGQWSWPPRNPWDFWAKPLPIDFVEQGGTIPFVLVGLPHTCLSADEPNRLFVRNMHFPAVQGFTGTIEFFAPPEPFTCYVPAPVPVSKFTIKFVGGLVVDARMDNEESVFGSTYNIYLHTWDSHVFVEGRRSDDWTHTPGFPSLSPLATCPLPELRYVHCQTDDLHAYFSDPVHPSPELFT